MSGSTISQPSLHDELSASLCVLTSTELTNCQLPTIADCNIFSREGLAQATALTDADVLIVITTRHRLQVSDSSLAFLADSLSCNPDTALAYADYVAVDAKGSKTMRILNDAEAHVLRDSFDYGPAIAVRRADALRAIAEMPDCQWGAIYALTLAMQRIGSIYHTGVPSGILFSAEHRDSGERQFDYVNPANADYQAEMERIATHHLKAIGADVRPENRIPFVTKGSFANKASVIIPVKNRCATVADAIRSALNQETDFPYNIIVIDNHSTDGTSDVIRDIAAQDSRVVHLIPQRADHGIGGCWNEGVASQQCGQYAVQLDSDDIYSDAHTLQKVVEAFAERPYAMVVGSYKLVDFDLNTLPPGVIDHREWTDENGANNILRINGMGAPRAFATEWLRENPMPDVSYGEDYAAVLAATRKYLVGRIFDVLYLCRRWGGNSDAGLSPEQEAKHNAFKDKLRSDEVGKRLKVKWANG